MARSPHRIRAVLNVDIISRLETLVDASSANLPDVAQPLLTKIAQAKLVPSHRLPGDVATIGRALRYQDAASGREQQLTLAWPEEADISSGLVSVMTPVGVALLGLPAGADAKWTTRSGTERVLTVLSVTPDAVLGTA